MNINPQISIIVPVYNTASTLDFCISSIIKQDFKDWELLLIDDGSTDDSLNICQRIESSDHRIKVFSQNNSGVSAARNKGLKEAKGKYICFIDADDYIEYNYLSSLYKYKDYDLVICGYYVDLYSNNITLKKQEKHIPTDLDLKLINDTSLLKELFFKGMINTNWNKLFKHHIIKEYNIQYKPYPINEDNIFMLEYLMHISSIYTIPQALYHWIRIENRITGVDSIPHNILSIYNESHLLTRKYINQYNIADITLYYSYNFIVLKYFSNITNNFLSKRYAFAKLKEFHNNPLVKASYLAYKPKSKGEKIIHEIQKRGYFKLYYFLHQTILKWIS